MDNLNFNYHSFRAQKARIGHLVAGVWLRILTIIAIALIILGLGLLVLNQPIGWLLMSLAALP
ncbi:MAG TPA: hypothetical protein VF281_00225, partial [Candidatus Saccharimonadales bacterium]